MYAVCIHRIGCGRRTCGRVGHWHTDPVWFAKPQPACQGDADLLRRNIRTAAFTALVVLAASACGTPEPGPGPAQATSAQTPSDSLSSPVSTPSAASSSSSAEVSIVPEAARANTADGAVNFAIYFLDQSNKAFVTLDIDIVQKLSLPECKTCTAMINQIADYKSSKQRFVGEFAHPTFTSINKFEGQSAQVLVENATAGARIEDSAGHLIKQLQPDRGRVIVSLNHDQSGWRVFGIQGAT